MGRDIAGTLTGVVLNGISFRVAPDINVTEIGSSTENEMIPATGKNMLKKTKRVQMREGVVLLINDSERVLLQELAEADAEFDMSYEVASKTVYTAAGFIEFESRETQENRASIKLLPVAGWENFIKN